MSGKGKAKLLFFNVYIFKFVLSIIHLLPMLMNITCCISRQVMKDTLDQYLSETLSSIGTIEYFCKGQEEWAHHRQGEIKSMLDIKSRADQVKFGQVWKAKAKDKFKAMKKCMRSRVTANREELEKELAAVLEHSLMGLKELRSFLEAVEKLAVTSPLVFTDWEGNALDICSVIYAAKTVAPLLIQFKRDDAAFFLPNLSIVEVLAAQLDIYINITIQICKKLNGRLDHLLINN